MKLQMENGQWWQRMAPKLADPALRVWAEPLLGLVIGLCLSAAALGNLPQPFCLAVLCSGFFGWSSLAFALGSSLGYWLFWGQAAMEPLVWVAVGAVVCVLPRQEEWPLLVPCLAAMTVAVSGLAFQLWQGKSISIAMYLLQVALSFGSTCLVQALWQQKSPLANQLAGAVGVLGLAQIAPIPFFNCGIGVAACLALVAPLPGAALAGLALDLAGVTAVPMTAVLCLTFLVRRIPHLPRKINSLIPGAMYLLVMGVCGQSDWLPLPALLLGGAGGMLLSRRKTPQAPGVAEEVQLRLQNMSTIMAQTGHLLQEVSLYPLDEGALIQRSAEDACGACSHRRECTAMERAKYLPHALLHQMSIAVENLPGDCREKERLLARLQRGQERYRLLRADRQRQQEYRGAVIRQYTFLAGYLQDMAEQLPHRTEKPIIRFRPEVAVCSRGKEHANGDRCIRFSDSRGRYYLLLCDGMGTGEGAAYEARLAGNLLRRMLVAGVAAQSALENLNSLCVLRQSAGAVTVDLAQIELSSGRTRLFKWGAAPSWHLRSEDVEKIGRECPPPGFSVEDQLQMEERLDLSDGSVLVMLSDGVDAENALEGLKEEPDQPAGFLATQILENGASTVPDDATAVVVRLHLLQ